MMSIAGAGSVRCLAASTVPVAISVRAKIEGQTLHIFGKANVPNGAWIIYAAYRTAPPRARATGYAQVRDDRFAAHLNVANWLPGPIKVDVNFQVLLPTRKQPAIVTTRFGKLGERMTGSDVVKGGGTFRAAVASTTVVKP
ncbi:MAG: hypothetical protein ACREFD_18315 [Stellaceae bacterium]